MTGQNTAAASRLDAGTKDEWWVDFVIRCAVDDVNDNAVYSLRSDAPFKNTDGKQLNGTSGRLGCLDIDKLCGSNDLMYLKT